jgi:hypothetical protein
MRFVPDDQLDSKELEEYLLQIDQECWRQLGQMLNAVVDNVFILDQLHA